MMHASPNSKNIKYFFLSFFFSKFFIYIEKQVYVVVAIFKATFDRLFKSSEQLNIEFWTHLPEYVTYNNNTIIV